VVDESTGFTEEAADERPRLVRLCARLVGDREAAEDLAQEALLVAWRNARALRDPLARDRWLAGIARNLCRRWLRARGRDRAHLARPIAADAAEDGAAIDALELLPDCTDIELELERDELATLLDRALALLPPTTRDVLVAHYIRESPHAEIAARLRTSEKAVSMRLVRGKLLLRHVLVTELRDEAAAYGLGPMDEGDGWRETRIWCPLCGDRRLLGRFDRSPLTGGFALACPGCCPGRVPGMISATTFADVPALGAALRGVGGYKAAFNRLLAWSADFYRGGLARRVALCPKCGRATPVNVGRPTHWPPAYRTAQMIHLRCDRCGITPNTTLAGLALALPEVRRFWRVHRRVRLAPDRAISVGGHPAVLTTFASVADDGRLDVLSDAADYRVLRVESIDGR
jgi:RNA polymerase sigma factor (sigma-70 family)